MKTRRMLALVLAIVMLVGVLAACNNSSGTSADTGKDGGTTAGATSIAVCIASEPDTIDPALNSAVDGATMLAHLFSGLAKWAQKSDGSLEIVADAAKELVEGVENEDGTVTYTYTLRDGLKWSDGQDLKASDFVYSWNRAISEELAADYGYMFEVVKGYDEGKLAVEAPDDKTLVVTLVNYIPYWNELLAFPTYYPVREDVVADEGWATDPSTYVCNGLYTLDSWTHNSVITLKKNENHPDAASVTMDTINFYLSDDDNNKLTNFKNGEWQFIDGVPNNEIPALKADYPDEFKITAQIGTYYVCWNVNEELLPADTTLTGVEAEAARAEIRQALSLLIDRNYIVESVSQGGELPAAAFVPKSLTDADGATEFFDNSGHNEGYAGYYDVSAEAVESNYNTAIEILKKYYEFDADGKITNFPTMTYLYNTSETHQAIGEYIQSAFANVGITMNMDNQEWATFLQTRKAGDYSVARNGWVADYNDPISFLDMWISGSGNNDIQFGKGANADLKAYSVDLTQFGYDTKVENGTWAETYDVLIDAIKKCTDVETRFSMMHYAEDILMSTGCVTPIYYYTNKEMLSSKVSGFFENPLGYKYFMYTTVEG